MNSNIPYETPISEENKIVDSNYPGYQQKSALNIILDILKQNEGKSKKDMIALVAGTGTGKSTHFVARVWENITTSIFLVLPTVTSVKNAVEWFDEYKMPYNQVTGSIKRIKHTTTRHTNIATTNVLNLTLTSMVANLEGEKEQDNAMLKEFTDKYGVIIVDEVHMLSGENISLLTNIKYLYDYFHDNKYLPNVVFSSGTVDKDLFTKYFGNNTIYYFDIPNKSKVTKTSLNYPDNYESLRPQDRLRELLKTAIKDYIASNIQGTIMVFLPGGADIESTIKYLRNSANFDAKTATFLPKFEIYKLTSEIFKTNFILRQILFDGKQNKDDSSHKIILGTDVMETSITLPGVFYVIDYGFKNLTIKAPWTNLIYQRDIPETQANLTQRISRTGRTNSGKYITMYTPKEQQNLSKYAYSTFLHQPSEYLIYRYITTGTKMIIDLNDILIHNTKLSYLLHGFLPIAGEYHEQEILTSLSMAPSAVVRCFIMAYELRVNIRDLIMCIYMLEDEKIKLGKYREYEDDNDDTLDLIFKLIYSPIFYQLVPKLVKRFDVGMERYRSLAENNFADLFSIPNYYSTSNSYEYKNNIREILKYGYIHSIVNNDMCHGYKCVPSKFKTYIGFLGEMDDGVIKFKKYVRLKKDKVIDLFPCTVKGLRIKIPKFNLHTTSDLLTILRLYRLRYKLLNKMY